MESSDGRPAFFNAIRVSVPSNPAMVASYLGATPLNKPSLARSDRE
jgi:hypothetical protein